jgi:3-methyladenine DNA glycosylase/8-oxoguanine DNA glycosylase
MTAEAIQHLCDADKVLARLIRKVGPCTLKPKSRRAPFVALVSAVTYQQLNGTAAKTILNRVIALYPGKRFPAPEDLLATPDERLRAAGLSRAKAASVKDIAAKTIEGIVPDSRAIVRMSNEEILERLLSVRGVGPWTVEMLLMFTLGRTDVLPATDYGVRKGFALTYKLKDLPTPKELLQHGERWRPHRSTAAWYLWRALELPGT